jgi:hypothetical protein
MVAVDAGSGDVAYSLCSSSSTTSSGGGGGAASTDGSLMPLEAVLLSVCPADLVVCEPVSAATDRLLSHYLAGCSRRCRLERLQPEQWRQQQQQAAGRSSRGAATAAPAAGNYLDAGVLSKLTAFFSSGPSSSAAAAAAAGSAAGSSAAAAAAADSASDDARVRFVLSLPHPVLAALAGALTYLLPFGLSGVLQCTSSYRALRGVGGTLALDAAVLTQLEVLQSGGAEGRPQLRGSLLHLLDRCSTPAGGRMLRRWLASPLADRSAIFDRQQAVQVCLAG